MRNPRRIGPNWAKIAALHEKLPDWRMAQLLANVFQEIGFDPFYLEDDEFVAEVEKAVKTTAKKAAGKAAKAVVGVAVAKGVKKKAAPKAPTFTIESKMGGQITYDEIIKKVPKGADVYVKPEENKAYWVKGKKSGAVVLWE